jgi:cell cycle checkpoint control protein RAD9A
MASQSQPVHVQAESEDEESLFVPHNDARMQEEEDAAWAPMDYDKEETLGWDASADHDAAVFPTFRDSGNNGNMSRTTTTESNTVIEPTQRLSEIKGLW